MMKNMPFLIESGPEDRVLPRRLPPYMIHSGFRCKTWPVLTPGFLTTVDINIDARTTLAKPGLLCYEAKTVTSRSAGNVHEIRFNILITAS